MEFSGSELILKRNFFTQTGNHSFFMTCTVDNTTGQYSFGLTGNGNIVEFVLNSGKIFYQNKFLHSYNANQEFSILTELTPSKINLLKNEAPLMLNGNRNTGLLDYFFFKRESQQIGAIFNVEISGDTVPPYRISENGYIYSSGQNSVTGTFENLSQYPIKIFNSSIQTDQPYNFAKLGNEIPANSTGVFVYSGDFQSINFSQPILTIFNTNFGDLTAFFNIINLSSSNALVFLEDINNFEVSSNGIFNRNINYTNYSGGFATTGFQTQLTFILDYVSGSGDFIVSGDPITKTFSGSWAMYTGVNSSALYPLQIFESNNGARISGGGYFNPNSFVNFQLSHIISGENSDSARLTISGDLVSNPISNTFDI